MLYKLKQWSQRILDRSAVDEDNTTIGQSSSTSSNAVEEDPRELPRPLRHKKSHLYSTKTAFLRCYKNPVCKDFDDEEYKVAACSCSNCTTLPQLTECGVCLEPLQSHGVRSCPVCANLTCKDCAARLTSCAFCRTAIPAQPNRALERLLDRLSLPCKNSRWGCTELLESENRAVHETNCLHGSTTCPVGRSICGWRGNASDIGEHLRSIHELLPLSDQGIAVEISGFRGKAFAKDGRQYTVCLACYGQLFVVKIILFQGKLRLSFSQLGTISPVAPNSPSQRYGVWVDVNSSFRSLKGLVPFGKRGRETREIEIVCDTLVPRSEKSESKDSVKLDVVIKPISFL